MNFIIFSNVVLLLAAAQVDPGKANPEPLFSFSDFSKMANSVTSEIKNAISSLTTDTSPSTTPNTSNEPATPTPAMTSAKAIIQNEIDKTNDLERISFDKLDNSVKSDKDDNAYLKDTIDNARQIVLDAVNAVSASATNVNQHFNNIIHDSIANGEIDQTSQTITDISRILDDSKLKLILGSALTNIVNKALAKAGDALATKILLTSMANAFKALSNIAVLNDLVDKIDDRFKTAWNKPSPSSCTLSEIQRIFIANEGVELRNAYDTAIASGVEDLSTTKIPVTQAVYTSINDIITVLSNCAAEQSDTIESVEGTTDGIVIDTNSALRQIGLILLESVIGQGSVLSNIIGKIGALTAEAVSFIKSEFPPIASLIDYLDANTGEELAANFLECVSIENKSKQNFRAKYQSLIKQYQTERDSGLISTSILVDTVLLTADNAFSDSTAEFMLYVCETTKAASTANGAFTAAEAVV